MKKVDTLYMLWTIAGGLTIAYLDQCFPTFHGLLPCPLPKTLNTCGPCS